MLVKYNGYNKKLMEYIGEIIYNETERHYNAHYNNTKQYYSNQHYNKADNKDSKQNGERDREHFV